MLFKHFLMGEKIVAQHDETTLQQLEYYKIVDRIRANLATPYGEKQLNDLTPLCDIEKVQSWLTEVNEMVGLLEAGQNIPLNGLVNIQQHLEKVKPKDSFLESRELQEIKNNLILFKEINFFFREFKTKCPSLFFYSQGIHYHRKIVNEIQSAVDDSGEILDNASSELRQIRNELSRLAIGKQKILQKIIKRYSEFSQDDIVTLRDGRMVIGVKQQFVSKVNGIVHGISSSGATAFVEPMESLQVGNQIQNLKIRERTEIIKILKFLTGLIREIRDDILYAIENIAILDLIHAKSKLAIQLQANVPQITDKPIISLIRSRHPLLILKMGHQNVVPQSLELGKNFNTLVITGPNAGGKTVTMKTVGLLLLMTQIGMPIPADADSKIPLLPQILVDIGDRQSLEDDLSTFSAHIVRLSDILRRTNQKSLVHLDEIGTSTDPKEGSALSLAILSYLTEKKALTIATTHHGELKAFAHNTPGVENASMQFNLENLQPTYQMSIGIPGSSYAFEIAKRYGLNETLIKKAQQFIGQDKDKIEDLIIDLGQRLEKIEKERRQLNIKLSETEGLKILYEKQMESFCRKKKELFRKASEEAQQLLKDSNAMIERLIGRIKSENASRESNIAARKYIRQKKDELKKIQENADEQVITSTNLKKGNIVYIPSLREEGELLKEPNERGKVQVLVGNIKMTLDSSGMTVLNKTEVEIQVIKKREHDTELLKEGLKPEIDLRGLDSEEAIEKTNLYLTEIAGSGWEEVHIIHGKGSGVLRKRVNEFLSRDKRVLSKRLGKWGEGDTGVTIVTMRK